MVLTAPMPSKPSRDRAKGFPGYSDVLAMSPGQELGELDPIFPSR